MGKKRKARGRAPLVLTSKRVQQLLLATSFPRLHMALILALAAVGAFLTSASLVALGVSSMGLRYALAVVGGYLSFLGFVRLWIAYQTRNWSFGRRTDERGQSSDIGSVDLPDLSALGELGSAGESVLSGGGGAFGGAGASGSFGDSATEGSSGALDAVGGGDGEGVMIVIAVVALLGGIIALGFVVYSSPLLLAEVLLDFAVVGALYRKNQRRTYKPALVLAVFAAVFGLAMQSLAPEQHTLGAVLEAYEAAQK
ncbi:MAG: hypothetical protein EOO73_11875 [Myxococcales bacterium]|nr:MAG: hypothetical protein EOO73_11875 [Myxococcales bacterium]